MHSHLVIDITKFAVRGESPLFDMQGVSPVIYEVFDFAWVSDAVDFYFDIILPST